MSSIKRIISKWSDKLSSTSFNFNDILIKSLLSFYNELNDLNLVFLNKLVYKYWFACPKNNEICNFNFSIDNKKIKTNISNSISLLEIIDYKYIEFEITLNKIKNSIYTLTINNKIYYLKNIIVKNIKNSNDWSEMISASSVRNYLLSDPLLDFIKEYNINSVDDKPSKTPNNKTKMYSIPNFIKEDMFTKHIMDAGIKFEDELIKILSKKHKIETVADGFQSKKKEKFEETIKLMKLGCPIIYQGVLHNYHNKTFGLPDLLVRSDYINKLMGYSVISNKETHIKSPKLKLNYHYKVIDIKHSTIQLRSDGVHILNSDSIPAYKGQLYIYTVALNAILGININKAFIWGKKYIYTKNNKKHEINNFMNKLGIIDYDTFDMNYVNLTKDAINWMKTLRKTGNKWSLLPVPSRTELYPNMKNEKDGYCRILKKDLSKRIYEITDVWSCGVKRRKIAHENNIFGWNNPLCTSTSMGINNKSKQGIIIDKILDINRQDEEIIRPMKIMHDRENWHININNDIFEFYLDFETLNSNFGSIIKEGVISYNSLQHIFLIGLGYSCHGQWKFKNFIMHNKSDYAECLMFDKFIAYVKYLLKINNKKKAKFYHWSNAEVSAYSNFCQRVSYPNIKFIEFYDLNKIFIEEPITIKNALNFSLKSIAKALYNHNLIKSSWDTSSPCSNGLNAMILANNIYDKNNTDNINNEYCLKNNPIMKEIIYYNEIDCKVMWEIHNLIKKR